MSNYVEYTISTGRFEPLKDFQKYGAPRDEGKRTHKGIDVVKPDRSPVDSLAECNGSIYQKYVNEDGGHVIYVKYDDGTRGLFSHQDRTNYLKWQRGQRFKKGELIGYGVKVGNADTNVLHYQKQVSGRWVDPNPYVKKTSMTKLEGVVKLKPGLITVYDSDDKVVTQAEGGTVNKTYAIRSSGVEGEQGTAMFATSEKLDRWVHVRSTEFWGQTYTESVADAVGEIKEAQNNLNEALAFLAESK